MLHLDQNKEPPHSYGLSHHKTFGTGLSHDIPHARSSLDLSDGHYHQNVLGSAGRTTIAGRPPSGTAIAYTRPWEPRHVDMTASHSMPVLHESKADRPEYLAARAELRGAAGATASFGELPRCVVVRVRVSSPSPSPAPSPSP